MNVTDQIVLACAITFIVCVIIIAIWGCIVIVWIYNWLQVGNRTSCALQLPDDFVTEEHTDALVYAWETTDYSNRLASALFRMIDLCTYMHCPARRKQSRSRAAPAWRRIHDFRFAHKRFLFRWRNHRSHFYGSVFVNDDNITTDCMCFVFSTSRSLGHWGVNMRVWQTATPAFDDPDMPGVRIHTGMRMVFEGLMESVVELVEQYNPRCVVLTGHSLGGALSLLFALHLARTFPDRQIRHYGWGPPRVGNMAFADMVDSQPNLISVLIRNTEDVIPNIFPPPNISICGCRWTQYVHPQRFCVSFTRHFDNNRLIHCAAYRQFAIGCNAHRQLAREESLEGDVRFHDISTRETMLAAEENIAEQKEHRALQTQRRRRRQQQQERV